MKRAADDFPAIAKRLAEIEQERVDTESAWPAAEEIPADLAKCGKETP